MNRRRKKTRLKLKYPRKEYTEMQILNQALKTTKKYLKTPPNGKNFHFDKYDYWFESFGRSFGSDRNAAISFYYKMRFAKRHKLLKK